MDWEELIQKTLSRSYLTQIVLCSPQKGQRLYSLNNISRISGVLPPLSVVSRLYVEGEDANVRKPARAMELKHRVSRQQAAEFSEESESTDEETERVLKEAFRTFSDSSGEPESKSKSRPNDEMHLRRYDFKDGIRVGSLVPYKIKDRIVFPETGEVINSKNDRKGPMCRRGTFCEDPSFYPTDMINRAIRSNTHLMYLEVKDELEPNVSLRTSGQDEVLCESKKQLVRPRVAKNKRNKWRYIVNTENFTQAIGVEICDNTDSPCKLVDGFAGGYRTMCKQNYIYRELVAIVSDNVATEKFQIPASCCCHVQFIGDPTLRMGANLPKSNS